MRALYAGRGIGRHLLLDAFRRSADAAAQIGGRGIMAHAKDEEAARFYLRWKFDRMPGDAPFMVIPIEVVRTSLDAVAAESRVTAMIQSICSVPYAQRARPKPRSLCRQPTARP